MKQFIPFHITIVWLFLVGSLFYVFDVLALTNDSYIEIYAELVAGTAKSPFNQRVLLIWLSQALPYHFVVEFAVFHLIAYGVTLWAVWAWLRTQYEAIYALIGVMIVAIVAIVSYKIGYYGLTASNTTVELMFLSLGLLAHRKQYRWLLGLCILVAPLNRATGAILALTIAIQEWPSWRSLMYPILALFVVAIVYTIRPSTGMALPFMQALESSVTGFLPWSVRSLSMIVPLWVLASWGAVHADNLTRRYYLSGIIYTVIILATSLWHEMRLQQAGIILFVPSIIYSISTQITTSHQLSDQI